MNQQEIDYCHLFNADNVLDACRKCGEWATHDIHDIAIHDIKPSIEEKAAMGTAVLDAIAGCDTPTKSIMICVDCDGSDIHQQITMMIDPNNPPETFDWGDVITDDYYYCNDCEDDCGVKEEGSIDGYL